jgi:hypothetical protein
MSAIDPAHARASAYSAKLKYVGPLADKYVANRAQMPTWLWEQDQVRAWAETRPAGASVLDVPFGTGRYVPIYRAAGLEIRGCDISADMVAVARRELGADFQTCQVEVADAENMQHLADGAVDAVLCSRFIQWLPTLDVVDRILAEFARVAREELFLQLKIPAGAAPRRRSLLERGVRALRAGPAVSLHRLRRKLARHPSTDWTTYVHAEHEVLARAAAHGWRLVTVGEECPSAPGIRFYRLRKASEAD